MAPIFFSRTQVINLPFLVVSASTIAASISKGQFPLCSKSCSRVRLLRQPQIFTLRRSVVFKEFQSQCCPSLSFPFGRYRYSSRHWWVVPNCVWQFDDFNRFVLDWSAFAFDGHVSLWFMALWDQNDFVREDQGVAFWVVSWPGVATFQDRRDYKHYDWRAFLSKAKGFRRSCSCIKIWRVDPTFGRDETF
jgi:hypothetical protein